MMFVVLYTIYMLEVPSLHHKHHVVLYTIYMLEVPSLHQKHHVVLYTIYTTQHDVYGVG
jgi:hypothetical protein